MSGWSRVKEYQDAYNNGWTIGSAQRENEIFLDSIAGKWNTLKENLTKSVTTVGMRDALKDILDIANNVVLAVEKITTAFGKLGTFGLGAGITSFIKMMSNFDSYNGLSGISSMFNGFGKSFDSMLSSFQTNGLSGFTSGIKGAGSALKEMATSSGLAKIGTIALNAALNAIVWTAVIASIQAVVTAWDNYVHATENAVNASKEKQDSIRDEMQTLNSQKSSLQEIAKEYDTLTSKSKLTYEEASRLKELKQQIADISPELVSGYDANGDPILKLNGSLTNYIADLDKAIAKQQELYDYETKQQANEYLKQNDSGGSVDDKAYKTQMNNALDNVQKRLQNTQEAESQYTARAVDWANKRIKARQQEADQNAKDLSEISRLREEASAKDEAIQASYINNFQKNSKIAKEEYKNQFASLMSELDWSQLSTQQANQLGKGMEVLSEKTAFTKQAMGEFATETAKALKQFENTGAINTYGKALQQIAEDSGKFDIQSWSGYLDEVNARFEAGAMTNEQYTYSLGIMADTMSSMTGIPADVFETALKGTGNLEEAFQNATTGLNNFLNAYGKTTLDLQNGDSIAESLKEQFNDLLEFGNNFDLELQKEGKIDCQWLIDQGNLYDLPKQMQDMIDLVTADGEVTEVEEKVLMAVQTEIKNEGQLTADTVKTIEGLLDGSLNIDAGVEIAGLELSKYDAEQLREALQEAGITAEQLQLGDTGIEEAKAQAEALQQELDKISNAEIRLKIEEQGLDSAEKVQNLVSVLEKIPKEQKTSFIADTGQYFQEANTVEEAIEKIPDEIKLKYNIGIEGNDKLEQLKTIYDTLPESIQTRIGIENGDYTVDQIQMIKEIVDQFGETDATAFLSIDGAAEALAECTTVEEFLQKLQEMVVEGKITITADTEEGEEASELLEETDGQEATATINTELNEESYNKLQEALDKIHKEDGKETTTKVNTEGDTSGAEKVEEKVEEVDKKEATAEVKVEAETTEVDEAEDKVEGIDGKKGTAKVDVKANTTEVDEAEKKIERISTGSHGEVTVTVSGEDKLNATINEKNQLEVAGRAVTYVQVDGGKQYAVAINEKGQLEVNGVAQTDIDISGAEKLTLTKNEKGELEVNGQAVTDVEVNGAEKATEAKEAVEDLQKTDGKNVSVNIDISLKDTVGEILSRLGLNKKTEKVEIQVTCKDEATPVIEKITSNNNKTVTVTLNVNDSGVTDKLNTIKNTKNTTVTVNVTSPNLGSVKTQLDSVANKTIPSKTFNVSCPNVGSVTTQISTLASKVIPNKSFEITCNAGGASATVSNLASKVIPNKSFNVNCNDQATPKVNSVVNKKVPDKNFTVNCQDKASSKVSAIQSKKINSKSFTVSCNDRASSTLSNIKTLLANIKGKTVTVTVIKNTVSNGDSGPVSANPPRVIDTLSVGTPVIDNSNVINALSDSTETIVNATQSNNDVVSAMATKKTSIDASLTINAVKYNVDLLNNMSAILDKLGSQLDVLDKKQERTWGTAKAKLLKQEISLLEQQQTLLDTNYNNMSAMASKLKSSLKSQGFKFNDDGTISNYSSKLIALEKALEKAQDAQDAYTGDSESKQKSLQKAVDKANDALTKAKNELNEYYDLVFSEMPNVKAEWEDVANAIAQAKAEMVEANHEAVTLYHTLQMEVNDFYGGRKSTTQSTNEALADYVDDTKEKIKYLEQANKDAEYQIGRIENTIKQTKDRMAHDKDLLDDYGFIFLDNGNIDKGAKTLEKLAKSLSPEEYEEVYSIWQEYMSDLTETLPEAEADIVDLNKAMKDNQETMEELIKTQEEYIKSANLIQLQSTYDRLSDSLDYLDAKMESVYGKNKLDYMQEQINLIETIIDANNKLYEENKKNAMDYGIQLSNFGISFNDDGDILNLQSVMSNQTSIDNMEELSDLVDKYNDSLAEMRENNKNIIESQNQIRELGDSIIELKDEMKELEKSSWATQLANALAVLNNELDKIETQRELVGANQLDLMQQQIALYDKLIEQTQTELEYNKQLSKGMQVELISYGFTINDDGTIDNIAEKMENFKNILSEAEFEHVSDLLEDYFDVRLDQIPELENQLLDYRKSIQDVKDEIIELNDEMENILRNAWATKLEGDLTILENRLDKIEAQRKLNGVNQVDLMQQQITLYNQQIEQIQRMIEYQKSLSHELQSKLITYGFQINYDGSINDIAGTLSYLKTILSETEFDHVNDLLNDYLDTTLEEIPKLENEVLDYQNSIEDLEEEMMKLNDEMKELARNSWATELANDLAILENKLNKLDIQKELAGTNQLEIMNKQLSLYRELIAQSQKELDYKKQLTKELKSELISYGFEVNDNGTINDTAEKLTELKKILSDTEFDHVNNLLEDYFNVALDEIPELEEELLDYQKTIQDIEDEIIELNDEMKNIAKNAWATELANEATILENKLAKIQALRELSTADQIDLMQQQLDMYKKQTEQAKSELSYQQALVKTLSSELISYGFTINDDGTIDDTADKLTSLKKQLTDTEFDHVNQLLEDYFSIALNEIPEIEEQLIQLQKSFEDLEKEKLSITQDIEDKITSIIEKQVDERIKAIEEERDARIDALTKAKNAYNKLQEEIDYKDDYDKQYQIVKDLEEKVEVARRSTDTLAGQKRLQDLLEQLNEEQEKLEDIVTNRMNDQINDMFDEEMDRIQVDADEEIEKIENAWSESAIAEAVKEALQTGIFTDIDGNIQALDQALMDFANNSSDYLGVMGKYCPSYQVIGN